MKLLNIDKNKSVLDESNYPFNIPIIKNLKEIKFSKPITILVGENGSGKSSLIEALAIAARLPVVGADDYTRDKTLEPAKELAKTLKLTWAINNHRGFFMRAEDFFGFQKRIAEEQASLKLQKEEFNNKFTGYANLLTTGSMQNQLKQLEKRYGENPDAFSHGESFLNLFSQRLVPEGLYILDEPEVPLSPNRQLSLVSMIKDYVSKGCQFIIATHSPILMALPDATIFEIRDGKVQKTKFEDLEHVNLMKDFLSNPKMFIDRL